MKKLKTSSSSFHSNGFRACFNVCWVTSSSCKVDSLHDPYGIDVAHDAIPDRVEVLVGIEPKQPLIP